MDMDMLWRVLRQALQFAFGALAGYGLMTGGQAELWAGVVASAVQAGYVAWTNTKTARIAAVAKLAEVSVVATTPALAQAIPDPAVVSREAVKVAGRSVMSHGWLGALLAMTLALGGCAQMGAAVEASDNALARMSRGSLPAACAIVGVAEGYFDALAPRISPTNHARFAAARTVADRICADRPADTASAMITLAQAWADIQAATKAAP